MKIISAPSPSALEWSCRKTCRNCGTVVELAASDLKLHDDQRDGTYYAWTCPTCNDRYQEVAYDLVPPHVRPLVPR